MGSYLERHALSTAAAIGPGADASITFLHAGATLWVASSSDRAARCDRLETRLDEGPCIDAMRHRQTVLVPDISGDDRWPGWRSRALAEGFRWCVATPATIDDDAVVGLNLYAEAPIREDRWPLLAARVDALAADMSERFHRDPPEAEADASDAAIVEQAVGVLMQAKDCGPDEARALLERLASHGGHDVPTGARRLLDLTLAGHDPLDEAPA